MANKVRSALTMLGVIIGVSAVILLVAIGNGVQSQVTSTIQGLGSNLLFVFPGQIDTGGSGGGFGGGGGGASKPFDIADADLLTARLTGVDAVVPMEQSSGTVKRASKSGRSALVGLSEKGPVVSSAVLGGGRTFNKSEVDAAARICEIGFTVKDQLFGASDPNGQTITINGQRFLVIGWFEKQGGSLSGNQDNQIVMPITTLQNLTGVNRVPIILVKVTDTTQIDNVRG